MYFHIYLYASKLHPATERKEAPTLSRARLDAFVFRLAF